MQPINIDTTLNKVEELLTQANKELNRNAFESFIHTITFGRFFKKRLSEKTLKGIKKVTSDLSNDNSNISSTTIKKASGILKRTETFLSKRNHRLRDESMAKFGILKQRLEQKTKASIKMFELGKMVSLFDHIDGNTNKIPIFNEKNELEIRSAGGVSVNKQEQMRSTLEDIEHVLKRSPEDIPTDDLFKLLALSNRFYVNYAREGNKKKLDHLPDICGKLANIRKKIHELLKDRDQNELEEFINGEQYDKFLGIQGRVSRSINQGLYGKIPEKTEENREAKIELLQNCLAMSNEYEAVLNKTNKPENVALHDQELEYISSKKNVHIFKCKKEGQEALIIVPKISEKQATKLNPRSDSYTDNIGLAGHQAILQKAKKTFGQCEEALKNLAHDEELSNLPVQFVGYGIGGAVAQVLGYQYANKNPDVEIKTFGIGVPEFLERDSADELKKCKNLLGINLASIEDSTIRSGPFAKLGGAQNYSQGVDTYQVQYKLKGVSDITGHNRHLYFSKMEQTLKDALEMNAIETETEIFTQLSSPNLGAKQRSEQLDRLSPQKPRQPIKLEKGKTIFEHFLRSEKENFENFVKVGKDVTSMKGQTIDESIRRAITLSERVDPPLTKEEGEHLSIFCDRLLNKVPSNAPWDRTLLKGHSKLHRLLSPKLDQLLNEQEEDPTKLTDPNFQLEVAIAKGDLAVRLGKKMQGTDGGVNGAVFVVDLDDKKVGVFKAPGEKLKLFKVDRNMPGRFKAWFEGKVKDKVGQAHYLNKKVEQANEIYAYEFSQALGFSGVPAAKEHTFNGLKGAFIAMVDGVPADSKPEKGEPSILDQMNNLANQGNLEGSSLDQYQELFLFRLIMGYIDDHPGNHFIKHDPETGEVKIAGIDHGNMAITKRQSEKSKIQIKNRFAWKNYLSSVAGLNFQGTAAELLGENDDQFKGFYEILYRLQEIGEYSKEQVEIIKENLELLRRGFQAGHIKTPIDAAKYLKGEEGVAELHDLLGDPKSAAEAAMQIGEEVIGQGKKIINKAKGAIKGKGK